MISFSTLTSTLENTHLAETTKGPIYSTDLTGCYFSILIITPIYLFLFFCNQSFVSLLLLALSFVIHLLSHFSGVQHHSLLHSTLEMEKSLTEDTGHLYGV